MHTCCCSNPTAACFAPFQVETAGDCYIVAGALMTCDSEGFISLNRHANPCEGARNVVDFAQVGGLASGCRGVRVWGV